MKKSRTHYYRILIIPDDKNPSHSLKIPRAGVVWFIALVVVVIGGFIALFAFSSTISYKLLSYKSLQEENKNLQSQVDVLEKTAQKIDEIITMHSYLAGIVEQTDADIEISQIPAILAAGTKKNSLANAETSMVSSENEIVLQAEIYSEIPTIRPVEGWITRHFSMEHEGVDFAAARGTIIRATAPGTVLEVSEDAYLGKIVVLQHKQKFTTRYSHCDRILVDKNQKISRGQAIALVGNTGRSSAPHLHYEIFKDGAAVDPINYMVDNNPSTLPLNGGANE